VDLQNTAFKIVCVRIFEGCGKDKMQLIASKIKVCLHNMCVCAVNNYFVYINTFACMHAYI